MAVNKNRTLLEKYGIPLDHIDFNYVNECEDPKELKRIIQILESGEEGYFPKLLLKTEDRLRQIKPDASILNRKLYFAQKSSDLTNDNDFDDVFSDISKWIKNSNCQESDFQSSNNYSNGYDEQPIKKSNGLESMFTSEKPARRLSMNRMTNVSHESFSFSKYDLDNKEKVEKVQASSKIIKSKDYEQTLGSDFKNVTSLSSSMNGYDDPPVRGSINLTSMFNSEKPEQELSMPRLSCLPHEPLEASYIKWDKYDPDVEIMKMDNKEKINKLQTINKKNINSNSLSVGLNGISSHIDRFKSMKNYVDTLSKHGILKPQDLAMREKILGNEYFNSNDYEEAICHYNTSIDIYSTPEARNNRAMSFIKLKKYEQALDDLREVIESDPRNVKAHFRRGSCFKAISMLCLALRSFEVTLKYDCNNLRALCFVKELKSLILNLSPKKLIRVREITRHYDQTVWDIEEPFHVTYVELAELNKERVEYLYEADTFGCLTECVCHLCPWHEWQQRKKKWSRHKIYKNEELRKRWQFLTPDIVPILLSKSLIPEVPKPKRLIVTEISSSKINGHHTNSVKVKHNGVNGKDQSPCEHCDNDELCIKPVSNVQEFLQNWKIANKKKSNELYHKLLRSIKPKDLPKVISTNLDEEIMSTFLETLNRKFDPDSELDLIAEYLIAMSKVNRFNLIVKMLDNKVKEGFQPLMKRIHHHTKNSLFLALL